MQNQRFKYISKGEIERLVTDLVMEGYDEGQIIDQLQRIDDARRKREMAKLKEPQHISETIAENMKRLGRCTTK